MSSHSDHLLAAHGTSPALSVVICTWNRAERLRATLRSIFSTDSSALARCEIIVIDNGSTDTTSEVARAFGEGGLVYEIEAEPGLSNARNCGVRRASAPWLLFLDDDVEVGWDFFSRYLAHTTSTADAAFFGGPVVPAFDGPERSWTRFVLESHSWVYSCLDLGGAKRPFGDNQLPFGANFCVRRDLLSTRTFSPKLGYKRGVLTPGEETALLTELRADGAVGWWLSDCPVRHCLPEERNRLSYLVRRAFGQGRLIGMAQRSSGASVRWAVKAAIPELLRFLWKLPWRPAAAVSSLLQLAMLTGVLSSER